MPKAVGLDNGLTDYGDREFARYLRRNPHGGRYLGLRVGRDGRVDPGDLARAAGSLVMIQTRFKGAPSPWSESGAKLQGRRSYTPGGPREGGGGPAPSLPPTPAPSGVSRRVE